MAAVELPVTHVFVRDDVRKTNEAAVRGLVSSIREVGIINPLRVRPVQRHVNGILGEAWEVTAGAHRLAAAIKAGLDHVPCIIVEDDELVAELVMIDENLMRAELSPAERASQTARRKKIYEELHPETKVHVAGAHASNAAQGNATDNLSAASFAKSTAEVIGKDERTVRRDAERGLSISEQALAKIKGTRLDTGVYLDQIKKLSPEEQEAKVERDLARPVPKVVKLAPEPVSDEQAKEAQVSRLMSAWNAAGEEARKEFLARIEQPVMDRRFG